jgi:hypothetical protein
MSKKTKTTKAANTTAPVKEEKKKSLSLLAAAAAVLENTDEAMSVSGIIKTAKEKGLWTPGEGKTPEQTLYSAIVREIKVKGETSRFKKDGRGRFSFAG